MLTREQFEQAIKDKIAEKNILNHPFYKQWNEGTLSISVLQDYAKQYYHFVEHFPMFVSSVHSNCSNPEVRRMLVENLADEEGFKTNINAHPELWLSFAEALGVKKEEVEKAELKEEAKKMVNGFYELTKSSDYKTGLSALLGYEFQIPEVSRVKIDGLKKYYGLNSYSAIEFFSVHEEADIYHSRDELNAILDNCNTEDDQRNVLSSIGKSTSLYWQMLDIYIN